MRDTLGDGAERRLELRQGGEEKRLLILKHRAAPSRAMAHRMFVPRAASAYERAGFVQAATTRPTLAQESRPLTAAAQVHFPGDRHDLLTVADGEGEVRYPRGYPADGDAGNRPEFRGKREAP